MLKHWFNRGTLHGAMGCPCATGATARTSEKPGSQVRARKIFRETVLFGLLTSVLETILLTDERRLLPVTFHRSWGKQGFGTGLVEEVGPFASLQCLDFGHEVL